MANEITREMLQESVKVMLVGTGFLGEHVDKTLHKSYLGMVVVLTLEESVPGKCEILTPERIPEDLDVDTVWAWGFANMLREEEFKMMSMADMMGGLGAPDGMGSPGLFVATNARQAYGASVILDITMLKKMAEIVGGDVFILPSSIHEVLFLKADMEQAEDMAKMVRSINRNEVMDQEVLSDHCLIFRKDAEKLEVAA